jgi:hypothetical protein
VNVRRPLAALAAAGLAVVALAGCSADQAGTASQVGATRITDRQVADLVSEVQEQDAAIKGATFDEKTSTIAAVTMLTRHLVLQEAAAKEGITVTQGEVDKFLSDITTSQYGGDRQKLIDALVASSAVPKSQINDAARDQLVYNALLAKIAPGVTDQTAQSQAFSDYLKKLNAEIGVDVSPRFGTWNVFSLGPVPDDISTPAAGSSASATPSPSAS